MSTRNASRRSSRRLAAGVAAVLLTSATLSGVLATPALAATIVDAGIVVTADGTGHGTVNECLVEDPGGALADQGPDDRVVCTDDSVLFGWNYGVAADGADDVVFRQTLPPGWRWDPLSLTSCTGGDDYTGVPELSPDGLTLTCTLTFPSTGSARSGQIPVLAVPEPGIPDGAAYAAELEVVDDGGTVAVEPAEAVTVRAQPRWNLVKHPGGIDNFAPQADFGDGLEDAVNVQFWVSLQPVAANNFKGQDTLAPFSFEDVVTGISPDALLVACGQFMYITPSCTQAGGVGGDVTIDVPGGLPTIPEPGTISLSPVAAAGFWIIFAVPASEMPTYPFAKTFVNQLAGFDPDGSSGASNLGPGVEVGSEPGADCVPDNGNDNCARTVGTVPPPGLSSTGTNKSLRRTSNAEHPNCGGHWWWCEPLEGTTGTSANNDPNQGNQDGVAYRGDEFGAGITFSWNPAAAELPENPLLCDVWDPALQEFNPAGFPDNVGMSDWWFTTLEPTFQYSDQVFADDAAREQADCGAWADVDDGGDWYSDWEDVPGGPSTISAVRWLAPTSRATNFGGWVIPMKVSESAPVGAVVPDFLHLYYDQQVSEENPDGWSFERRDGFRVNDLQILLDKDTVPAGTTGAVAGARVPFSLQVSALMTSVVGSDPRELTGATVVDTLDPCMLEPQLDPASAAHWSMSIAPADPGPDGLACTADDVSGAVLTFVPAAAVLSGEAVPQIRYSVAISTLVANGQRLDNTAVVEVDPGVTLQTEVARTDAWELVVAAPGAVRISKVADFPLVEIEPDDLSWTIAYSNTLPTDLGLTEFIDVLPHVGDGRGSDFGGAFGFAGAEVLAGDDVTISYTTDPAAGIDPDPASNASTWVEADDYAGALGDVTAIRISVAALDRGEVGAVRIHADPSGNAEGDRYDNRVGAGRAAGLAQQIPQTLVSEIRVVASSIGDRVWHDVNADGVQDAGEPGLPGVTLRLYDGSGAELASTVTGPDGIYSFAGRHSGDYRVVVDESTLPLGFARASYDLDSGTVAPDGDSDVVALGMDADRVDVDFGYTREDPVELTISKVVEDAGAGWFGEQRSFEIEVSCSTGGVLDAGFPVTVVIEGTGSETVEAPAGAVCVAEETEDGGAHEVAVTPEGGILIDGAAGALGIEVENVFASGELVLRKLLDGPGVASFGAGPFEFSVLCVYGADEVVVLDETVVLERVADETVLESETFTGLPLGSSCEIAETGIGGADAAPDPVAVVIDDAPAGVVADLTNWFSAGTVSVAKVVEGDLRDHPAATEHAFTVLVSCQIETEAGGEPVRSTLFSGPVVLRAGEVVELAAPGGGALTLPVGARCFLEETDAGSATASSVSHASFEEGAVVVASGSAEAQRLELVATNAFDGARLTVSKLVTGGGSPGPYSFALDCSRDGEPVELPPADAAFVLRHGEERTIAVPVGSDCAVREVGAPVAATVTLRDSGMGDRGDGVLERLAGDDNSVVVTNAFPAVLGVTGTSAGPAAGIALAAGVAGILLLLLTRRRRAG